MTGARVKALVAVLLMVGCFMGAKAMRPTLKLADTRPKISLENLYPKSFGNWTVDDRQAVQLVSPDQQAMLSKLYNETLSRTYVNTKTGQRVMLSVAYGGDQSDGTRAHLPELCYPAQGFQILSRQSGQLSVGDRAIPVQRIFAKLGGRLEPVTYWVVVGEQVALTGPQQKLAQLRYSLRGLIPDGTLIRVSNIDSSTSPEESYQLHDEFVREMTAAIPADLKVRVVGEARS